MDVRVGLWRKLSAKELMLLNGGVGEDSWESLGLQGDPTSPFWRRSALGFLWKEWCWSWNSSTLATSCEELTHWKRLWCWQGLGAGGEGDDRGWDGWMASLTWWTWVWVNSGSWWWTGRPDVLQLMESQRVRHDWATELNRSLKGQTPLSLEFICLTPVLSNQCLFLSQSQKSLMDILEILFWKTASPQPIWRAEVTNWCTLNTGKWVSEWVKLLSCVWLFVTPWTVAYEAPLSKEFSGKSTGMGCHFLLQGNTGQIPP